jgi:hypothetical protein
MGMWTDPFRKPRAPRSHFGPSGRPSARPQRIPARRGRALSNLTRDVRSSGSDHTHGDGQRRRQPEAARPARRCRGEWGEGAVVAVVMAALWLASAWIHSSAARSVGAVLVGALRRVVYALERVHVRDALVELHHLDDLVHVGAPPRRRCAAQPGIPSASPTSCPDRQRTSRKAFLPTSCNARSRQRDRTSAPRK